MAFQRHLIVFLVALSTFSVWTPSWAQTRPDGVLIEVDVRSVYGMYERTHICTEVLDSPSQGAAYLTYNTTESRISVNGGCNVPLGNGGSRRAFEFTVFQSVGRLSHNVVFDDGALEYILQYSYQSDLGLRLDKILGSYSGSWGRFSIGTDQYLLGELIETGFLPGGLGNIADDAYVTEHHFGGSRKYGQSYAPRRTMPDAISAAEPRLLYESPSLSGWYIGTAVSIGKKRPSVYWDHFPVTIAFTTRYHKSFDEDRNSVNVSLAVSARPFIGGVDNDRILINGAAHGGLTLDLGSFRLGAGLSYEYDGADAYTGQPCAIIPWLSHASVCEDRYAFHISSGYVFQNVTVGGGIMVGLMPGSIKRDEAASLVASGADSTNITSDAFGTDSYVRFGVGSTVDLVDSLSIFADMLYTFDNIAAESNSSGVNNSQYFIVRTGLELSF